MIISAASDYRAAAAAYPATISCSTISTAAPTAEHTLRRNVETSPTWRYASAFCAICRI